MDNLPYIPENISKKIIKDSRTLTVDAIVKRHGMDEAARLCIRNGHINTMEQLKKRGITGLYLLYSNELCDALYADDYRTAHKIVHMMRNDEKHYATRLALQILALDNNLTACKWLLEMGIDPSSVTLNCFCSSIDLFTWYWNLGLPIDAISRMDVIRELHKSPSGHHRMIRNILELSVSDHPCTLEDDAKTYGEVSRFESRLVATKSTKKHIF